MKKIVSLALSLVMIASMTVSYAATTPLKTALSEYFQSAGLPIDLDDVKDIPVATDISVSNDGGATWSDNPVVVELVNAATTNIGFEADIDMSTVKAIFAACKAAGDSVVADNPSLADEYASCYVTGEFVINIDIPKTGFTLNSKATSDTAMKGFASKEAGKDFNQIFEEVDARTKTSLNAEYDRLTIKVKVKDGVGVNALTDHLSDLKITYTGNKVASSPAATYTVRGSVTGSTDIKSTAGDIGHIEYTFSQKDGEANVSTYRDPADDISATVITKKSEDGGDPYDGPNGGGGGGGGSTSEAVTLEIDFGLDIANKKIKYNSGATVKVSELPVADAEEGYTFKGYFYDEEFTQPVDADFEITKNTTIYGKWEESADVSIEGTDGTQSFNKGETIKTEDIEIPFEEGKLFGGFYYDAEFTQPVGDHFEVTGDTKLYIKWIENKFLDDSDHFAYVIGYPTEDGVELVRPTANITREEVATVFYRLLKKDVRDLLFTVEHDFHDVEMERWSNKAIATMANGEFINGYNHGGFEPSDNITRAEFATIAARLLGFNADAPTAPTRLLDAEGHWADEYIRYLTSIRLINGYEDDTFRPDRPITRAEVMKIVNSMLNRSVNEEGLVDDAKRWVDNSADAWYYYDVIEATNSHAFSRAENTKYEKWAAVLENQVLAEKAEMEDAE